MNGLYAIPLGTPFLPALVKGLIARTTSDPLSLARYTVILPTRRGCLGLQQAFLAATPTGFRVLPRIIALADIEEGADLPGYVPPAVLPPAMPAWQRLGLMGQLVLAFEKQKEVGSLNPARAIRLAQELMRLIDEVETTGLDLGDLKTLVGADYATHWQLTLDFLKILTDFWPPVLEQANTMEPSTRKRLVLEQVATHWRPTDPVVLAGTTASRPSTTRLAQAILTLEKGCVVLPGFDLALCAADREALPPTHPQYTLARLVTPSGTPKIWNGCPTTPSARTVFLSKAMAAAHQEDWEKGWHIAPEMADEATSFMEAIEAPSLLEEARQIALIMRYELETPGQTVALVTPDGELTRRVQSALGRWNLHANLSSGLPLPQSVVGRFLLLTSLLAQNLEASELLAILKHPLCAKGLDRLSHLKAVRKFETEILRNLSPNQVSGLPFPGHEACTPLMVLNDGCHHSLATFLKAHAAVAESLVGATEEGSLLWSQEDGQAASLFWSTLLDHAHHFPTLTARDYPAFLHNLMASEVVREGEGIGSRLLILGTLEARLLQADVVILGSLNEGTWPAVPEDDPWLSRSMRESFGLPPLERKIGLSAHDFCTAMTASKVYLTRALKRDGAPTLPSRWWQRLSVLLATTDKKLTASRPWAAWSSALDAPLEHSQFSPPAPCPLLSARPDHVSVTDVETLLRDPYSFYAKKILKLFPLDPLDEDLSLIERGQAIHEALDAFIRSGTDPESPDALPILETLGREAFGSLLSDPRARAFWWPRFQRLGSWFLRQMTLEKFHILETKTELSGKMEILTTRGTVTLTTKADRIDLMASHEARIIDYKTGMTPTKKAVESGQSPQLPLEGLVLAAGGFEDLPPMAIETLDYWKVSGGTPAGEIISFPNASELVERADQGIRHLFEEFLACETPFLACPIPRLMLMHSPYAHLERLKEWSY